MNRIKVLSKSENQEILNKLKNQFGISEINGTLIKMGSERIFLFQGSLSEKQLGQIEYNLRIPIERVGVYFAKLQLGEVRLSIEGVHILKNQITKNIFQLNDEQAEQWMMGSELNIQTGKRGFLIMQYNGEFLGCGKASELKISNYIPKNRRLKSKS